MGKQRQMGANRSYDHCRLARSPQENCAAWCFWMFCVLRDVCMLCGWCVMSFTTKVHNSTTSRSYSELCILACCWHQGEIIYVVPNEFSTGVSQKNINVNEISSVEPMIWIFGSTLWVNCKKYIRSIIKT